MGAYTFFNWGGGPGSGGVCTQHSPKTCELCGMEEVWTYQDCLHAGKEFANVLKSPFPTTGPDRLRWCSGRDGRMYFNHPLTWREGAQDPSVPIAQTPYNTSLVPVDEVYNAMPGRSFARWNGWVANESMI